MATQKQKVLEHLRQGESLTAYEALHRYGIMRLAARILELKQDGHPVKSEWIIVNARDGETEVKKYYFESENEEVEA